MLHRENRAFQPAAEHRALADLQLSFGLLTPNDSFRAATDARPAELVGPIVLNCHWDEPGSTSAMWLNADDGGVEQPDGSFLHQRTHALDPRRSFNAKSGASGFNRIADPALEIDDVPEKRHYKKNSVVDASALA